MKWNFQNYVQIYKNSQISLSLNKICSDNWRVYLDVYFAWNNYLGYSPKFIPNKLLWYAIASRNLKTSHNRVKSDWFFNEKKIQSIQYCIHIVELCINEDAMTLTNLSSKQKAKSILFDVKMDWSDVTPNGMMLEVSKK